MDLTTVAQNVLALLAAEGATLSDDLNEVERLVRETVQRIGAKAIEIQLTGKSLGYEGSSRPCDTPACRCDQRFVSYRPRTLATLLGQVTFQRAYDIGSGRVESACNHVVKIRMKRSGMIWSDAGAQEMLSLRTALLNGWWDDLWAAKPLAKKVA